MEAGRRSSSDRLPQTLPADPVRERPLPVPGPVDQERLALDLLHLDETPETAVETLVSVVAHDEVGIRRDFERAEIVARLDLVREDVLVHVLHIGFHQGFPVDPDPLVADLHRVAWQADHAFDEVLALVLRELEHDDVAPLGFGEPDQDLVPVRQFEVVQEFRDVDVVADRQGRNDGAGGDFEGLDDEGPDEEGQDDGDEDGLAVLAPQGLGADGLGLLPLGGARDDRRRLARPDGYNVTSSRATKPDSGTTPAPTYY